MEGIVIYIVLVKVFIEKSKTYLYIIFTVLSYGIVIASAISYIAGEAYS